jgi:hypothetical protein
MTAGFRRRGSGHSEERPAMTTPIFHSPLPPIRFRAKPFREFARVFDKALAELESRYPTRPPMLTISDRKKILRRRPK